MKKTLAYVLSASLLVATTISAQAGIAKLGDSHGKVLVNHGKGFVAVTGAADLNVGDRVMIGEKSFATLSFADCAVALSKPTVFTVKKKAPCVPGEQAMSYDGSLITPVADVVDVVPTPFPYWLLLAGGGAAVVATIVVLSDNNNSVSP